MVMVMVMITNLLYVEVSYAQLSGRIIRADNGQAIRDAHIMIVGSNRGTISDSTGYFFFKHERFPAQLVVSAMGFTRETLTLSQAPPPSFQILLRPVVISSQEVLVYSGRILTGANPRNPIPVTSITYDELQLKQNSTAADLLRSETGVYVQQTTPGQGSIYVRGRAGRDVLYLYNGLRMNPSFVRAGQNQYFGAFDPFSIDQMDVFRGPISTFYGSDALSGGVNIVPRLASVVGQKGGFGRAQFQLNLGGNGERTLHLESGYRHPSVAVNLSGTLRDFNYYAMPSNSGSDRWFPYKTILDENDYTFGALNTSVKWAINEASHLTLHHYMSHLPDAPRWDRMILGYSGSDSPQRYYDSNTSPLSFGAYQLEYNRRLRNPWLSSINVHAGYHHLKDHRKSIRFMDRPSFANGKYEKTPSDLVNYDRNTSHQTLLSVDLRSLFKNTLLFTWGADVSIDITESRQYLQHQQTQARSILLSRFPDGSQYLQNGVFAHIFYGGDPRWTLDGGIRFSSTYAYLPMEGIATERGFDPYQQWFSQLTGSLGFSYQIQKGLYGVANVGTGFRAPNVADLSEVGIRRSDLYQSANPDLKPEQSLNIDVGFRTTQERLYTELSAYWIHYFDKIDIEYTGDIVDQFGRRNTSGQLPLPGNDLYFESQSVNASSMNLLGLESQINLELNETHRISVILNHNYGRIRNAAGVKDYVDRIPPTNGILQYEVMLLDQRLRIRPQARFARAKRSLSLEELGDDRISPEGTDGFINVQLITAYDLHKHLQLRLYADNLTNRVYREHASTLDGMRRNVTISLSYGR
jgi:outer membrane receptor protein involved in Fe transport